MHVMQSEGLDFLCFIPRLMLPPKHLISDTPRIVGASEIRWKNHNHVYRKIVTNEYNQIMDVKNLDNSGTKQQTLDKAGYCHNPPDVLIQVVLPLKKVFWESQQCF